VQIEELSDKIRDHVGQEKPLSIVGGNSKDFYGADLSKLEPISTLGLNQIISYEPSELVIRVQAGCSLEVINAALEEKHQMLGFEPPDFGGSTIGGAIASGIAGSRRPFAGAGRDFLLGVDMIDGTGEVFTFGGQVMKNVAGYDVSRLMAGALGCLGLITEVSLKVLPRPEHELTSMKPVARLEVLSEMKKLSAMPEVSGLAWWQSNLYVRFCGSENTVKLRLAAFGGDLVPTSFWQQVDTMGLFSGADKIWRVSTKPMDQSNALEEADLIDWSGSQRWLTTGDDLENQVEINADAYMTLVKTNDQQKNRFAALSAPIEALHKKLKATFDPFGILNPNKMYEGI
jgi:glycolate oxidase FAD binding subunit